MQMHVAHVDSLEVVCDLLPVCGVVKVTFLGVVQQALNRGLVVQICQCIHLFVLVGNVRVRMHHTNGPLLTSLYLQIAANTP